MPSDAIDRAVRAATPRPDLAALRSSPCGMAHERIRTGPDGLPLRDATTGGYSRPDLCPAAVRNGNLGCSHTTARLALMRAFDGLGDGLEGDGIDALREELRSLDAALGIIDHRRHGAESRRADALWARDGGAAALAEDEIRAIIAEHRAGGLRAGEIRDLLAARLAGRLASRPAERPGREGEVQAAPPALAEPRSRLYAGR